MLKSKARKQSGTDPLYAIFDQHLMEFEDASIDRTTFIAEVLKDYLSQLRRRKLAIPPALEQPLVEELATQVSSMLIKKIYGFVSIEDYRFSSEVRKKRSSARPKKSAKSSD